MKVVVFINQILDPSLPMELIDGVPAQRGTKGTYILSPADRVALEEAVQLRKARSDVHVVAITYGRPEAGDALRYCLARGVDEAIHVLGQADSVTTDLYAARVISKVIEPLHPDLILFGAKVADNNSSEMGPFVAEILGLPQITGTGNLELVGEDCVRGERNLARGLTQLVECQLPAVITVNEFSREPSYVSTFAWQRAGSSTIDTVNASAILEPAAVKGSFRLSQYGPPRPRPKKIFVPSSDLSPEERLNLIMYGNAPKEKKSTITEGEVEDVVREIVNYLVEIGVVP